MRGIDLDKPITFLYSSLRFFADNEYHVTRYCSDDVLLMVYEGILRFVEDGVSYELHPGEYHIQKGGSYQEGEMDVPPVPGKNLTLSLDIELQALAERLLQNKIGSVVAIEPATGEVLCMASSPSFDPQMLVGRQRGDNHRLLSKDKQKPLLNRAIMGTYPPGSTFKTSQALTFLQEGIVTPETQFPCALGFKHKGLRVGCHAHIGCGGAALCLCGHAAHRVHR